MILNRFPVDPSRRKIVILSTPKTGNTWLRWLLRYAYGIQMVELPLEWAPGCTDDFLRVLLRTNISSRARALSDGRMIPPIRRIPARMPVVNDEIGNIDKVTDQLQGGMDIKGWAAPPWKHEVPDASFFGALNEMARFLSKSGSGAGSIYGPCSFWQNRRFAGSNSTHFLSSSYTLRNTRSFSPSSKLLETTNKVPVIGLCILRRMPE
jgi:hypothetical protein